MWPKFKIPMSFSFEMIGKLISAPSLPMVSIVCGVSGPTGTHSSSSLMIGSLRLCKSLIKGPSRDKEYSLRMLEVEANARF